MFFFSPRGNINSSKGWWTEEGMWVCKSLANLTYCLFPGSKNTPSPSWTFDESYIVGGLASYPFPSYPSALRCKAAQDHQGSGPNLHRAVLSYHCNTRQQHSQRASCLPSKGKYTVLAPKKLAMMYRAVCFPWKRAIKQFLEQCIYIWIARFQSQPVCKYKRLRLSWNKASFTL